MLPDYEKLGAFYLGRLHDLERRETTDETLLYDSKDLCTHAVVVGMTGSGKTGLCLDLIEEAAIDGIPTLAIDPKGDIGNLLLNFPGLTAEEFRPWIDESIARREGLSPEEYAAKTAERWKIGLAKWDQTPDRIQRLRDAVEMRIYTPASNAGYPLTVLRSLDAPAAQVQEDQELMRERIASTVSGLLALLDIDADPINSREHILISNLLQVAWSQGKSLTLADLFRGIRTPPFDRVGILDLESFYPEKERTALALRLNNLMASPTFAGWLEGEPLNIHRLLYTPEGKPRIAIVSIAHLSEKERMFFVTLLLNEVLSWVRTQHGTSSLRALLYMDEVFGFFPPTAMPPSKRPMLTLLKQARAYGLGVVLATQNPVDLDYKGLSNTGTWFIGRLQTERDKARVMEGLEGASVQASGFDRGKMESLLAGLGSRVFLMNNVHDDQPVTFETRWALSYLRGPLTREQIKRLKENDSGNAAVSAASSATSSPPASTPQAAVPPNSADLPMRSSAPAAADSQDSLSAPANSSSSSMFAGPSWNALKRVSPGNADLTINPQASLAAASSPSSNASAIMPSSVNSASGASTSSAMSDWNQTTAFIPPSIPQRYAEPVRPVAPTQRLVYRPGMLAVVQMHYVKATLNVDLWQRRILYWDSQASAGPDWEQAQELPEAGLRIFEQPSVFGQLAEVPRSLTQEKRFAPYGKAIKEYAYRGLPLNLLRHAETKQVSRPEESESEFRVRLTSALNEQRDLAIEKLKQSYATKFASLDEKIKRAEVKVQEERSQFKSKSLESAVSVGASLLGAMFGRKTMSVTNVSRAGTALKSVGRAASERTDIQQAEQTLANLQTQKSELEEKFKAESSAIEAKLAPNQIELESAEVSPRKTDIALQEMFLLWVPYAIDSAGIATCLLND